MQAFTAKPLRGAWHLAPNPYGARTIPGTRPPRLYERARLGCLPGGAGHGGRDIDADSPDRVLRAVWAGTVHLYGWDDFGNHLGVVNSEGSEAFYAHLATFHVTDGQTVAADDDLGILGATGNVTGPHCHFELRTTATDWCSAVDPTPYLLATPAPAPEDTMYIIHVTGTNNFYNIIGGVKVPIPYDMWKTWFGDWCRAQGIAVIEVGQTSAQNHLPTLTIP